MEMVSVFQKLIIYTDFHTKTISWVNREWAKNSRRPHMGPLLLTCKRTIKGFHGFSMAQAGGGSGIIL